MVATVLAALTTPGWAAPAKVAEPTPVAKPWVGSWYAEGRVARCDLRYLKGQLVLRSSWPRLGKLELRGAADRDHVILSGKTRQGTAVRRVRLEAVPRGKALRVAVLVDGLLLSREIWHRPGTAGLEGITRKVTHTSGASKQLQVSVRVLGRPQRVALRVVSSDGDYRALGKLVYYEERVLPLGKATLTWSGRDRTFARNPVRAGRYLLEIKNVDDPIGPPPVKSRKQTKAGARLVTVSLTVQDDPRTTPILASAHPDLDWPELADPDAGWPLSGLPPGMEKPKRRK